MDAPSAAPWLLLAALLGYFGYRAWKRASTNHPDVRALQTTARKFADGFADRHPTDERAQTFRKRVYETRFERSVLRAGYSVNKGERIAICIDDGLTNEATFVLLHELAHVYSDDWGHTDTYWSNFAMLLREAGAMGIWTHVDYEREPNDVCGDAIEFTPM